MKVMGCEKRKYDKAMEKIDVCCFTTIDTECSRTKKKIPMNSGCLCRDRQKILAPKRHKDEYYRSLPTLHGWCNVWDDRT